MTASDIGFWVSTAAAVLAALYAILGYHRPPGSAVAGERSLRSGRSSVIACVFACAALCGVGLDYYDRHEMLVENVVSKSQIAAEESDLSPKQFMALYGNRTPIEARDATKPFYNKLMHFQGVVLYPVQIEGTGYIVVMKDTDGTSVDCEFGSSFEARARVLKTGDTLAGTGVIRPFQNGNGIALIGCLP